MCWCTRDGHGEWLRDEVVGENDIPIPLDTRITLDEIYDGIELPPLAVGEGEYWEDYGDEEFEEF